VRNACAAPHRDLFFTLSKFNFLAAAIALAVGALIYLLAGTQREARASG